MIQLAFPGNYRPQKTIHPNIKQSFHLKDVLELPCCPGATKQIPINVPQDQLASLPHFQK